MTALLVGLLLFLGVHSIRIGAPQWRDQQVARNANRFKALYTVVSLVGFALIVWGYGLARQAPVDLYSPPGWTRHLAAVLTLPAFVLLAAAYVPATRIKAKLHHPMVLGVKLWAIAHLIANGRLADVVLFGAFLAWAVLDFKSLRARDRAASLQYPSGRAGRDLLAVTFGVVAWAVFGFWLHGWLIGVRPFG